MLRRIEVSKEVNGREASDLDRDHRQDEGSGPATTEERHAEDDRDRDPQSEPVRGEKLACKRPQDRDGIVKAREPAVFPVSDEETESARQKDAPHGPPPARDDRCRNDERRQKSGAFSPGTRREYDGGAREKKEPRDDDPFLLDPARKADRHAGRPCRSSRRVPKA